jgi:hypothetical protein
MWKLLLVLGGMAVGLRVIVGIIRGVGTAIQESDSRTLKVLGFILGIAVFLAGWGLLLWVLFHSLLIVLLLLAGFGLASGLAAIFL